MRRGIIKFWIVTALFAGCSEPQKPDFKQKRSGTTAIATPAETAETAETAEDENNFNATTESTDSDPTSIFFSEASLIEGEAGKLHVYLSKPADRDFNLSWNIQGDKGQPDFETGSGEITITKGSSEYAIEITPILDEELEGEEKFPIVFSLFGTELGNTSLIKIYDVPEDLNQITLQNISINEGENAEITLALESAATRNIDLEISLTSGSASPHIDFKIAKTEVTIFQGQTEAKLALTADDDTKVEGLEYARIQINSPILRFTDGISSIRIEIADND